MKKLKTFIFVSSLIGLGACSNSNSTEKVAERFNLALYKADFEGAKALCTKESKPAIDFMAAFMAEKTTEMEAADIRYKTIKLSVATDGNSAKVVGIIMGAVDLHKEEEIDTTTTRLHLVKQNNEWLVEYRLR